LLTYRVKAFEKTIFGPGTLVRTWGTRPISLNVVGVSREQSLLQP
jgi:hypothetical protein